MVARERLLLRYSLLWLALAAVVLVVAIFPGVVVALGGFFGFEIASNFIFFIGLFLLMAIALSLSMVASKSTVRIVNLIQQQALLETELEELRRKIEKPGE
jgi:hypothetical protein